MKLLTIIILLFALIGCSLPVRQASPEALQGGYSCEWKCIITTDGKWSGSFGGMQTRTLQGKGRAVVCLSDSNDVKIAVVQMFSRGGDLTVQIVGPDYEGQPQMTDAVFGVVSVSTGADQTYEVEYSVTGTVDNCTITYINATGGTSQTDADNLPWTFRFTANAFSAVFVSAKSTDSTGTITTTILVNGQEYQTATGKGREPTASVSGILGSGIY